MTSEAQTTAADASEAKSTKTQLDIQGSKTKIKHPDKTHPTHRMKIILTGASGLLGAASLQALLARQHKVIALYAKNPLREMQPEIHSQQLDLTEINELENFFLETFPDVIIHTAALSSPAACEANPTLAEKLNLAAPKKIAELSYHLSARLYHISSNMVFDGSQAPYSIGDTIKPANFYGELKAQAEKAVLQADGNACILRVPTLTGNSPQARRSPHEKLFEAISQNQTLKAETQHFMQPTCANNTAELIAELIERPTLKGILHWAGTEKLSKFEMLRAILEHFKLPPELIQPIHNTPKIDMSLSSESLRTKIRTRATDFQSQLEQMEIPEHHHSWYQKLTGEPIRTKPRRLLRGRDF